MTPPLMYYSAAWAWLEYLAGGPADAEAAMATCLELASKWMEQKDCDATAPSRSGAPSMDDDERLISGKFVAWAPEAKDEP